MRQKKWNDATGKTAKFTLYFKRSRVARHAALTGIIILAGLLACANRFVQDDAFISFRYAENLANGQGLVWNAGERVEGYTNFLWVILLAAGIKAGIGPVSFVNFAGLILLAGTLYMTFRIGGLVLGKESSSLLATAFLGSNYTFASYATGGLETMLHALLITTSFFLVSLSVAERRWPVRRNALLSLIMAAAILSRPDSLIFAGILGGMAIWRIGVQHDSCSHPAYAALSLLLPAVTVILLWVRWKIYFYGAILPNTFFIKATGSSIKPGIWYLYLFMFSYWLFPIALLALISLGRIIKKGGMIALFLFTSLLWTAYVVYVGGDFMEFRFFVPVMPLMFITAAWLIYNIIRQNEVRAFLAILIIAGSLHHGLTFNIATVTHGIDSIPLLRGQIEEDWGDWAGIGKLLRRMWPEEGDVLIAVNPAGAIPFYSQLKCVDMLGLNDKWIARYGDSIGHRPGHRKLANVDYLLKRRVNLVIGHPWIEYRGHGERKAFYTADLFWFIQTLHTEMVPPSSKIIKIPLDAKRSLIVWYLQSHPSVDKAIKERNWPVFHVRGLAKGKKSGMQRR